jgi:hypothetical protein
MIDYQKQFLRRTLFWLIILTGIFLMWYLLSEIDSFFDEESAYVPVSINAIETADYKLNAPGLVNSINLSIISEVLRDESLSLETPLTIPNQSTATITPSTVTSTPVINITTTLLPNGTSVVPTSANPTLEPILTTLPPPPPIIPTVVEVIPSLIPSLLP